uniref:Uncharacterized protein n=1 Tax=Chromera velia CCMP2878 TaxID=1169474 RepID=A0A0G4HBC6_9ALVE|eukprot:Cvel_6176.t1-p1 / transcript=Cvel_6176.t1 / gene=Cvel_6176 / organism=Chromera_velia_CCMP2878 / gene_product=hypothetical protein / transcript_product=hypothetical protein / location=Cvel_scaffold299:19915-23013(+) / protein_length=322 / sequence_SO=supercontig / SO=protein_coding / is_pseudo=false
MSGDSKEQRVESLEEGGGVQGGEEEGGAGGDRMKFNWTLFLQEYGQHLIFHFADLFGDAMQWASLKTDPAEAEIAQTQVAGLSLTVVDAALIAFVINVVISIGSLVFDVFAHMETNSIEHKYTREDHQYREGKLKAQRRNSLIRLPLAVVEDVPSLLVSSFVLSLKGHDINGIFFYNLLLDARQKGGNPHLRLGLVYNFEANEKGVKRLVEALDKTGHAEGPEELNFEGCGIDWENAKLIFGAMQRGHTPNLKKLELDSNRGLTVGREATDGLAAALESGGLAKLERLSLWDCRFSNTPTYAEKIREAAKKANPKVFVHTSH